MFCQPVYELWFDEMVARGRLPVKNYSDPFVRAAWTKTSWVGPARGAIDENKEIAAATDRIALGVSTRQIEAEELQQADWLDLHKQLAKEMRKRKEDGLEAIVPVTTVSAAVLQQEQQQKQGEQKNG